MPTLSRPECVMSAACALACVAGLAQADPPAVLDYVPSDAAFVVTVSNLGELMQDVSRINTALGDQGNPMLPMMMGMMGGMPGMDMTGSMAVVVSEFDPENMDPSKVQILLPVTDLNQMVQAMGGVPDDAGVVTLNMQGQQISLKRVGDGFAVAGMTPEAVNAFEGGAGQLAAHTARLGVNGTEVVLASDLAITVNLQAIAPFVLPQIEQQMAQAQAMMEMMPEAQAAGAPMEAMNEAVRQFFSDATVGVLAINADEAGVGINFAAQFKEESELAGFFDFRGDSSGLLDRVPGGSYFYAGAADLRWPGFPKMMDAMMVAVDQAGAEQPELKAQFDAMLEQFDLDALFANVTGYAQVVNVNPEGMMAGLLKNSTTYISGKDPAALKEFQKNASSMFEGQVAQGAGMQATYTENAVTIEGVQLDAYSTAMGADAQQMGGMGGPSPAMMMQMMYGPDMGPTGYLGQLEGGVVQTTTQEAGYVGAAIRAARNGGGLGADERLASISKRLPSGRFLEAYLGTDHLLNNVMPMAAMFGMVDAFEPVEPIAPMAVGVSGHSGGMNVGLFIPLKVIEVGATFVPDDAGMDQMGNDDPEF
ncbi:MAG: hypothetical protein ACF8Q5_00495 [Phycisphaerales bacterium JB040]